MTSTMTTTQATAETLLVRLDSVQSELESARDYETFSSCKAHLEAIKGEIEALGYGLERVVVGWKLVQPMTVAQPATHRPAAKPAATKKQVVVLARILVKRNNSVVYRIRNGGGREYQVCLHADGSSSCADSTGETCMAHQYGRQCYHVSECRRHEEARAVAA
jgi:hypothetical protein